jgi:murein DD-endopeptidase MepM/ murein hydrolase activator NlpD
MSSLSTLTARAGRITLGLAITAAAIGGGAAQAQPTAADGAATLQTEAVALAGARPAFKAPFQCGTRWRGSAWTSSGGTPHSPLKSVDWNWGSGNDDKGKLVRASAGGTVEFADDGAGGYGKTVVIRHGASGWKTRYAHLLVGSLEVSRGDVIGQGKVIGKVGQSGGQSSSHLHYEQIADNAVRDAVVQGVRFDPNDVHYITSTNAC